MPLLICCALWPVAALLAQDGEPHVIQEVPTRERPLVVKGSMYAPAVRTDAPDIRYKGKRSASRDVFREDIIRGPNSYRILVPPGAKLKVKLTAQHASYFKVFFVNRELSTEDPGLIANRLNYLPDVAYYQNRTKEPVTIFCVVQPREEMDKEEYTLTFTDF